MAIVTVEQAATESVAEAVRQAIEVAAALNRHVRFVCVLALDLVVTPTDTVATVLERVREHARP